MQTGVRKRLSSDARLRSLVAWLLIQARARLVAAHDNTSHAEFLNSGVRTLVFTEYTDTQEYMLAALAALGAIAVPFQSDVAEPPDRQVRPVFKKIATLLANEVEAECATV